MHDSHLVESMHIEIDFGQLPSGPRDSESAQACLAHFMRGTALEIVDAVFDAALPMEDVWRLDRLDVDLGRIVVEDGQEWQTQWARALRTRLQRLLDDLRDAPADPAAGRDARHPMHRRQSQLETLLHFLRHGRMPWHGRGRRADDPRELAREVLRHGAREFAAALRLDGDQPRLLRRLASQFDDLWLAELVQALLPTEPTAASRLLEVVQRARRPGRADDAASVTRLWEAVLGQALAERTATRQPDVAVTRLQLQLALESGGDLPAPDDPLLASAPAWRRLLQDDRAWLRATLQRVGRSQRLELRLARALAPELLPEVAGLWLATEQTAAVTGWISDVVSQTPASAAQGQDYRRELWEAALSHFLAGGGDAAFDRRRLARKLLRRAAPAAMPSAASTASTGADEDWLRPGPAWWARLRADAHTLRDAVRRHVRQGDSACQRLAREWSGEMLLEAVCLQVPQSRQLVAAAVCSPPLDEATRRRRWACTLREVYGREAGAPFDERAYFRGLAHAAAQAEGCSIEQAAANWSAAVRSVQAAPAWFDRIAETAAEPGAATAPAALVLPVRPADAPMSPAAPNESADTAAPPPAAVEAEAEADRATARPTSVRAFAGRVVAALAQLASSLGRRAGRVFGASQPARTEAGPPPDESQPIQVDNAGLVLIGPYLPRLFGALGLLDGEQFVDEPARERAVNLMQYAVDGEQESAPESRLVLNKLLCGLEPAACLDRRVALTPRERALVDDLLGAVIQHWSILGSTTVAGLRETFLQRRGSLERRADGDWKLAVEPGSFDILIDRLPWGYGTQKHPWMSEALHVDWR